MAEKQSNKERLKDITDSIEAGIKELFQSDRYQQYLQTMSRFHRYSVNNQMLIYMQKPDATLVAGFNKWRDQFERHVVKGEKGIKIIAPTPFKKTVEEAKLDPDTKLPILDADGKVIMEEKEIKIPMYKVVSVFDVSQTQGKPLPELAANLQGNVQNYDVFMEALKRSSPVPISMEAIADGSDGYFSESGQRIAIREGMSEVQTVSAVVHEIAHAKLHNSQLVQPLPEGAEAPKPKDRNTEEVEAESISFAVCAYYGIATGENSFGYIAAWSKDKELAELKASLETINKTSSSLISDIDRHFRDICKERGIDLAAQQEDNQRPFRYYISAEALESSAYPFMENSRVFETRQPVSYEDGAVTAYGYIDYPAPLTEEQLRDSGLIPSDSVAELYKAEQKSTDSVVAEEPDAVPEAEGDSLETTPFARDDEALFLVDNAVYVHIEPDMDGHHYTAYLKEGMQYFEDGMIDLPGQSPGDALFEAVAMIGLPARDIQKVHLGVLETAKKDIEEQSEQQEAAIAPPVEEAPPVQAPDNGYLPDPSMSIEAMNAYGYTNEDMLPISKERALELLERDVTVYMLHDNNTEAMVFEPEDIQLFSGMFAVELAEWEQVRGEIPPMDESILCQKRERAFLDSAVDSFAIYQLKDGQETRDLRFMSSDWLKKQGLSPERDNYELVYTGALGYSGAQIDKLEGIYRTFNVDHPSDFRGHSLSVSDIVALKEDGVVSCHYVDSVGYQALPDFLKAENYLKNAEMQMEDDYGMIDGIINNGKSPSVAELEAQVKAGQSISLLDLANAVKQERGETKQKKPSVLEKLRRYQAEDKKSEKNQPSAERDVR